MGFSLLTSPLLPPAPLSRRTLAAALALWLVVLNFNEATLRMRNLC